MQFLQLLHKLTFNVHRFGIEVRTEFQVQNGTITKACPFGNSFIGLNEWFQRQQVGVRRGREEVAQAIDVFVAGDAEVKPFGWMAQDAVQVHAQGQVSHAAHAGRCHAHQRKPGLCRERFQRIGTGRQTFEDEGSGEMGIEAEGDGGFA